MDVHSSSRFISFQSGRSCDEGLELGSVVRKHEAGGVTLQSSQGDFAEWYKLAARQEIRTLSPTLRHHCGTLAG